MQKQITMKLSEYNIDCDPGGDCPEYAHFLNHEHQRELEILHLDWVDMGSPDVITVTVEPGDKLNTPPLDLSEPLTPNEIKDMYK